MTKARVQKAQNCHLGVSVKQGERTMSTFSKPQTFTRKDVDLIQPTITNIFQNANSSKPNSTYEFCSLWDGAKAYASENKQQREEEARRGLWAFSVDESSSPVGVPKTDHARERRGSC
jgi:hypothetical protein